MKPWLHNNRQIASHMRIYTLTDSQVQPVPVVKASPINPVPGGGALKIGEGGSGNHEGGSKDSLPTQRARATGMAGYILIAS